jgi:hypothetical protein
MLALRGKHANRHIVDSRVDSAGILRLVAGRDGEGFHVRRFDTAGENVQSMSVSSSAPDVFFATLSP